MKRIPMADLIARHNRVADRLEPELLKWIREGRYIGGPEVSRCEEAVASLFGRRFGVGVGSGTDAIALGLRALGVQPGDDVLIPALSFFATAGAVVHIGARPVVVDVLEDQPVMDPEAAKAALTPRTTAVVVVHLYGATCPDPVLGVPVLEDSAQAAGQSPPACVGAVTAVSFYPTKTLGSAGDGGLVATDDESLADRVRALGNHGHVAGEQHLHEKVGGHVGVNSRLDSVQAIIVQAHLADLEVRVAHRRRLAARFDTALGSGLTAVFREPDHAVHQYVLRTKHRSALMAHLSAAGIDSSVYYPRSLASQPAIAPQPPTPAADRWSAELLALPCHVGVAEPEVVRIERALQGFKP